MWELDAAARWPGILESVWARPAHIQDERWSAYVSDESSADTPSAAVLLRDGGELKVDAQGVHAGEAFYPLSAIQDARQIAPDPETIGMLVAGMGLVTMVLVRPGDAAIALEALYRLRPDLRPAGFYPPSGAFGPPQGSWPYTAPPPTYLPPQAYGAAPYYFSPVPLYAPPPPYPGYPIVPTAGGGGPRRGGLGMWPQGIGDVIGASFRIFFQNFWRFAALGLLVALWPALLVGAFQTLVVSAEGFDPWQSLFTQRPPTPLDSPIFRWVTSGPSPDQIIVAVAIAISAIIVLLLLAAWEVAALAVGAREAVLGRSVRIGAAMGGGLRRAPAVLGVEMLLALAYVVAVGIVGTVVSIVAAVLFSILAAKGDMNPLVALFATMSGIALYIVFLGLVIYFGVRLSLAPYAAAVDRLSPARAIARSWTLTRRNWWRTILPVFVVGLAASLVTGAAAPTGLISPGVEYLVVVPLLQSLIAPLSAVAYVVVYYDLRLRQGGYLALAHELGLPGVPPATMPPPPSGFGSAPNAPYGTSGPAQPDQPGAS